MKQLLVVLAIVLALVVLAIAFVLVGCGSSPAGPSTPSAPTQPPALNIHGSVTSFAFVLVSYSNDYGNINYMVTTSSNRAVSGCFVKVKWLDDAGMQVSYTFAATSYSIPQGTSTITDQHFMAATTAAQIKDSRVEYTLCQ